MVGFYENPEIKKILLLSKTVRKIMFCMTDIFWSVLTNFKSIHSDKQHIKE